MISLNSSPQQFKIVNFGAKRVIRSLNSDEGSNNFRKGKKAEDVFIGTDQDLQHVKAMQALSGCTPIEALEEVATQGIRRVKSGDRLRETTQADMGDVKNMGKLHEATQEFRKLKEVTGVDIKNKGKRTI